MSSKRKRSRKKYDYSSIEIESVKNLREICPLNEFRIVCPNVIKSLNLIPDSLLNKYESILIVASGSHSCEAYFMLNGNRVDFRDNSIDQMPFGFICSGTNPLTSATLTQHSDWSGRTHNPPDAFWSHLFASGIGNSYPFQEMPSNESGRINELNIQSQQDAFSDLVTELKRNLNEPSNE